MMENDIVGVYIGIVILKIKPYVKVEVNVLKVTLRLFWLMRSMELY